MNKMKIEVWSDIACPYCYIGKRKLENALAQFPNADKIELIWHSYELNPMLPQKALKKSYYAYLAEIHNTSVTEAEESSKEIIALAKEVGLNYNLDKLIITNTADALRLVKLAQKYNLADQAEEVLFKAYFTEGKNISDHSVLIQLGSEIGISGGDIIRMLDCHEYSEEIKEDMDRAEQKFDLQYIPFYLLNNKHIIQGSIKAEEYLDIITKAYNEWEQNGESDNSSKGEVVKGKSCSIDGTCSL